MDESVSGGNRLGTAFSSSVRAVSTAIRLLGSDDAPSEAKDQAATDLIAAARTGALSIIVGETFPLENVPDAHDLVDVGSRHRVVVALPD
jgi:NADPH2:quinone reductase